ncbi:MAG: transcription antitermination factor NusB [Clostridia bacterium]|nr:transcription antitermination factor NusB [Clostridia bacterium]
MSRKLAREVAFKVIFETAFQKDEELEKLANMLLKNDEEEEKEITEEDNKYIEEITAGVKEKEEELDHYIGEHLKAGWTTERISKVDIAILRLAIYEILYRDDIPYKVSVNEAVELAKTFSEESSPSFINGVLAEIISKNSEEK